MSRNLLTDISMEFTPAQAILVCRTLESFRNVLINDLETNRHVVNRAEIQKTIHDLAGVIMLFKLNPLIEDLLEPLERAANDMR